MSISRLTSRSASSTVSTTDSSIATSMMHDMTFSSRMSGLRSPREGSTMRLVTGLCFSKRTGWDASARVTFCTSVKRAPIPGRPSSTVSPTVPTLTRFVTSFVFTSSVPRP